MNFVLELNESKKFDGLYLVEKDNEKSLAVFYNLNGEVSLYIGAISPRLSQKNNAFFKWDRIYNEVTFTQINKPKDFLSLVIILGGEKVDYSPNDYL